MNQQALLQDRAPAPRPDPRSVRVPAGWLLACIAFWGAATDQFIASLLIGMVLEAVPRLPYRLAFSARHFERLADLCTVGFAALVLYAFMTYRLLGIYRVLAAFPWILAPLAIAQVISTRGTLPVSAFVMSVRRHAPVAVQNIDIRPVLGVTCLLAASGSTLSPAYYALAVAGCLVALLAGNRSPRYTLRAWLPALLAAIALAGLSYAGIVRGQLLVGDLMQAAFMQFGFSPADPGQTSTALGALGRLKLSERIRLRIGTPLSTPLPIRLTEARYQRFDNGLWRNPEATLVTVDARAGQAQWQLDDRSAPRRTMSITAERRQEVGALPLPSGAQVISGNDLLEIQRHPLGAVIAEAPPGFTRFQVGYTPELAPDVPPAQDDLVIPDAYRALLQKVAAEAGSLGLPAPAAVTRIEQFFATRFRYSLVLPGYFPGRKPLASFLLHDRFGHCEYFATATALLLRASGIPSRYVVGYVVDEYSTLERAFVARGRHAHAWTEGYVDGAWRVIDTTPGIWLDAERRTGFGWFRLNDAWNWLRWQLQRFQRGDLALGPQVLLAVPILALWLAWRLRALASRIAHESPVASFQHSTLAPLFARLARRGLHPLPGQTTAEFLLQSRSWRTPASVRRLLALYYRQRFRPEGLTPEEHIAFAATLTDLVAEVERPPGPG